VRETGARVFGSVEGEAVPRPRHSGAAGRPCRHHHRGLLNRQTGSVSQRAFRMIGLEPVERRRMPARAHSKPSAMEETHVAAR
jgi:hypothetical protein